MKLFVIIACHNRRILTVKAIKAAKAAAEHAGVEIAFTIYDDGSTDGTSQAVAATTIDAQILQGDGSAFWARSMQLAEAAVMEQLPGDSDYLVWLNDDVNLDKDAFTRLLQVGFRSPKAVIVGAMRDPESGLLTYSGMRRNGLHPLRFEMVEPSTCEQQVETFNGNLVMVPFSAAKQLGGIDGGFSHALADIDYGLRCTRENVQILLAPSTAGTCSRNEVAPQRSFSDDWRSFTGAKGGGNFRSLRRILVKSNPRSWAAIIGTTYVLWWTRRMVAPPKARRHPE